MAVGETDAQRAVRDDFGEGQVGRLDVVVTLDDLQVRGDLAEEVVGFFVGEVAEAEDLADFAGGEEFFELWRRRRRRMGLASGGWLEWRRDGGEGEKGVPNLGGYVLARELSVLLSSR